MSRLLFYTTEGCHLCEAAARLLDELGQIRSLEIEVIDISTDVALVNLYGLKIPVVKNECSGCELGWPFDLPELASLA